MPEDGHEIERIRESYNERDALLGKNNVYTVFNPQHLFCLQARQRKLIRALSSAGVASLAEIKWLDIGCGMGHFLLSLVEWGATPENLYGVDLMEGRVEKAMKALPLAVTVETGDAANLRFEDASFDCVSQWTVFSSILDEDLRKSVASEIARTVKKGGLFVWYDIRPPGFLLKTGRQFKGLCYAILKKILFRKESPVSPQTMVKPLTIDEAKRLFSQFEVLSVEGLLDFSLARYARNFPLLAGLMDQIPALWGNLLIVMRRK